MSDPIPKGGEIEAGDAGAEYKNPSRTHLPPVELPEELLLKRLNRLDTRRALAELCKSIPGLNELLLPPGIRADALTRRTGSAKLLKGISRRVMHDPAAWGAFMTAIQEQLPPETFQVVESLSMENLKDLIAVHTTEGLLYAALSSEIKLDPALIGALIETWGEENQIAEKRASRDAHLAELEVQIETFKQENEQLTFIARVAEERAASLQQEAETLRREREALTSRVKRLEEQSTATTGLNQRLTQQTEELQLQVNSLNRALNSERTAYASAAERVENLHAELGRTAEQRDRMQNSLEHVRFTDAGFGELLIRAVKNEVSKVPDSLEAAASTARLLTFMGEVLQAQGELRNRKENSSNTREDSSKEGLDEDPDPSPSAVSPSINSPPTLSFRALGGAGEVGGSSHFIDFGSTRVLVDAGIKPDARGSVITPDFRSLKKLNAAFITHAHLDHCGALPALVRDLPDLPIYCTPPSAKLIISALNDHAAMGGAIPGGAPIPQVKRNLISVPFNHPFKVGNINVTFTESGHILGAASVLLESGSATAFHTGDICLEDHFSIPSARLPNIKDIDLLIMEATLGDRHTQPFSESIRRMIEVINQTIIERGGIVLIPTYALGQAQEIILGLKHYSKEYGLDSGAFIYVDGSVVTTSERLYAEQLGYMKPYLHLTDPKDLFFGDNIRAVPNDDRARERILSNPCAVVASPVTMQGGASAFYRRRLENDPANAVILPSNAASYGQLKASHEPAEWRVERVSFAAHCTQDELIQITTKLTPRQIILIHGSRRRINGLASLLAPDYKIHTPAIGETVRTVL